MFLNFARFSHTFAYSHVISALQKAYLSATCICLIKLLWLVSTCFCVQVAHHSKTLVQVCFCFIVCLIPCKRLSFFIKPIAHVHFKPQYWKTKHVQFYSWFWILHDFHIQLLTVMLLQPCKRLDMYLSLYICQIFIHSCLQSWYPSLAKGLIQVLHPTHLFAIMLFQHYKRLIPQNYIIKPQWTFQTTTLHAISKKTVSMLFLSKHSYSRHTNRIQSLCYVICYGDEAMLN